jgi:DNA-binding GntR family transcriptional regulator
MALEHTALPRTAEAIAAAELRDAIVRGDLAPGTKIRQEATAQQLGISLIPVREALKTLAGEGVVTYHAQRGYFVTKLPATAIGDIYVVRDLLEHETEQLAIPNLTAADLAAMRTHLRDQARAVESQDAVEMIATNRRFHFTIFDRCHNPWLKRFVTQLWDTLDPYRVLSYRRMWLDDPERHVPAEILDEHERILTALEHGEPKTALHLLEQHRNRSETFLRVLVDPPSDHTEDHQLAVARPSGTPGLQPDASRSNPEPGR